MKKQPNKKPSTMEERGKKGGKSTLLKYGTEHFKKAAITRWSKIKEESII